MNLRETIRGTLRRWIRRRQGPDGGTVVLHSRRIYILPTRLGLIFAVMLFAMLLGSLNYANNLGLALTFLLAALGLVAMHACHRNLAGLVVSGAGSESPFAGQDAVFRFGLANPGRAPRIDIELASPGGDLQVGSVEADGDARLGIGIPTRRRGRVHLGRCEVATRYPLGLFRAWAVLHPDADCRVYPRPAALAPAPPAAPGPEGLRDARRGEDDFAGLKDYHPGDAPRRIAWKAHARGGDLLVKEFAGDAAAAPILDLEATPPGGLETRLTVLARWVVDAHGRGEAYGLRLPGLEIPVGTGEAQRRRCLAALADFGAPEPDHV